MRTSLTLLSFGALVASILILGAADVRAGHGGMNAMSIDMDEEATPANTSSSLGTRETCERINENNALDADEDVVDGLLIDVTAEDVPLFDDKGNGDPSDDTGGLYAYQFVLNYSAPNLTVAAEVVDSPGINMMAANPGPLIFNVSDPVPDDNADNKWTGSAIDNSYPPNAPESGDGVLHRITLESEDSAASGVYPLILTDNVHIDASGAAYAPHITNNDSYVAVNTACGDFDGDGVPDAEDTCPTIPGPPSNAGCPPPGPPAVGGTAGLIDKESRNNGLWTAHLIAVVAAVIAISLAGGALVRLVARRARP
jgi:hypothetical protein